MINFVKNFSGVPTVNDELKTKLMEFLRRDLGEIRRHKYRTIAMVVFIFVSLIYAWEPEGKNVEEIDLSDTPPVTKDLPVQKLPDKKISAHYYEPTEQGAESAIKRRLETLWHE